MSARRGCLVLLAALLGCDATGEGLPPRQGALTARTIPLGNTPYTIKVQRADIIPAGPQHFAVGWLGSDRVYRYAQFDAATGEGTHATKAGNAVNELTFTVRSSTSQAWTTRDGCVPGGVRYRNHAAVQIADDVYLDTHAHGTNGCAAWTFERRLVDAPAFRPSVATQGTYDWGRALVVYGKGSALLGRFLNVETNQLTGRHFETWGQPFTIATVPGNGRVTTTDVIFHAASGNFIVGYAQVAQRLCDVVNVVVSGNPAAFPPAIVRAPQVFFGCDYDTGGHATSSAYNPLGDGTYVWWRQPKRVFVNDAMGLPTANSYDVYPQTQMTVPVAATADAAMPYVFLTGQPERLKGLRADGSWTDDLAVGMGTGPLALRVLGTATVAVAVDARGGAEDGLHVTIWSAP